jgi:hypothetical protein
MSSYSFNKNYFDSIDSSDKAYWLGFIWGDGCIIKRDRNGYTTYEFKISLSEKDDEHLHKLKASLESTHEIKYYDIQHGFNTTNKEARLYISNKYFGEVLYNKYGIIKDRTDFSKIINNVPSEYYRDLLRGLIDSDGHITGKDVCYKNVIRKEFQTGLIASDSVLDFFNSVLINSGLTETSYKHSRRHEYRDGNMLSIKITGNNKVYSILEWMYHNSDNISLLRKYNRYIDIRNYMNEYTKEFGGIKDGKGNIVFKKEGRVVTNEN